MIPLLSSIGTELGIEESLRGTLITAYSLTLAVFALIAGPLSDHFGRRKILLWGSFTMATSLGLHILADDYTSILILRSLTGIAGGILTGSCVSYIGDYFPLKKRGWANGIVATGSAVGQIAGIPAGTLLADSVSLSAPFLFFSIIMSFACLMIKLFVPQPTIEAPDNVRKPLTILADYANLIRRPYVVPVAFGYLLMFLSITIYIVYFPSWIETEFKADITEIATLFLLGGLATAIGGTMAGKAADVRGRRPVILYSSVGLGMVMMLTTPLLQHSFWNACILFAIVMLLISARTIPFQALVSDIIPDHCRGKLFCFSIAVGQAGMGLGAALTGYVFSSYGFMGNSLIGATAVIGMALIVLRYIPDQAIYANQVEKMITRR